MFYAVVYFITGMWLFLRGSEITKFSLDIGVYADMISSCINTVAPLMSILLLCLSCLNLVNAGIVKRVVEGRTKTSLTITVVALLLTGVGLVYCFFKNKGMFIAMFAFILAFINFLRYFGTAKGFKNGKSDIAVVMFAVILSICTIL